MPNGFGLLWANFAVPVDGAGTAILAGLMALIGPWFKLGVPAYLIVVMLIAMWTGDDKANLLLFRSAFLASILYALSFHAGTFEYWVEGLVHGTTQEIRAAVAGGTGQQVADANTYDILITRTFAAGLAVAKQLPWYSPKIIPLGIGVVVYWLLAAFGIFWMFITDLISYTLGDFLIDLGPLFIPLYFFPFARRWFDGWLACLVTTIIAQILTAALAAMFADAINMIINQYAAGLTAPAGVDADTFFGGFITIIILAMVCLTFVPLACGVVYVAVRIGGGAAAHAQIVASPSWFGSNNQQHNMQHTTQTGGGISNATPPSSAPQPAFMRTVGSAP